MSLKTDYFDGATGLQANINAAFQAGIDFVGTGVTEISELDLGDRSGANLGAGSGIAGFYMDIDGPSSGYRVWISVAGEIAPPSAGRSLVQVAILVGDTRAQAAEKIGAAVAAISGTPFSVTVIGGSVRMETSSPKTISNPVALSAGWGSATATVEQTGSDATGNYSAIRAALLSAAAAGQTKFTLTLMVTYNPALVRGSAKCGPVAPSSSMSSCGCGQSSSYCSCSSKSNGNNLIAKAYIDGIVAGMAEQEIYSFEVTPKLNVSDTVDTKIDLCFHF